MDKMKLFASVIHLRLMGVPLILFLAMLMSDIVYALSGNQVFSALSFFAVSLGIPCGLLDTLFGFIGWLALPFKKSAGRIAWLYGAVNLVLMLLFTLSWLFRQGGIDFVSSAFMFTLSYVGILLGMLALWLGSEIVYGLDAAEDGQPGPPPKVSTAAGFPRKHVRQYSHRSL